MCYVSVQKPELDERGGVSVQKSERDEWGTGLDVRNDCVPCVLNRNLNVTSGARV